ncbi:OLC1v1018322C1 [Oldenlandia corymbosa var. corymbosa]|uniref:OLC1v1018322C1 n=1 Tax=Oldenlandia corymbosa var. corymbosa TaxID=529605 RepID=A0AAV1EBD7_OLDCO|nr:OLC1v1018322C1 [Oldenlandia corymbosa var. corymbosa]
MVSNNMEDGRRSYIGKAYNQVLERLQGYNVEEVNRPGFRDELWNHFLRLPVRYALDVNTEKAEDVLMHKKLLELAHDPNIRPVFEVRLVQGYAFQDNIDHDSDTVEARELHTLLHEITISTIDQPKLLTRMTALLSEVGLDIREAYAFSTSDGYSLDVFVVAGWPYEETDRLIRALEAKIPKLRNLGSF